MWSKMRDTQQHVGISVSDKSRNKKRQTGSGSKNIALWQCCFKVNPHIKTERTVLQISPENQETAGRATGTRGMKDRKARAKLDVANRKP